MKFIFMKYIVCVSLAVKVSMSCAPTGSFRGGGGDDRRYGGDRYGGDRYGGGGGRSGGGGGGYGGGYGGGRDRGGGDRFDDRYDRYVGLLMSSQIYCRFSLQLCFPASNLSSFLNFVKPNDILIITENRPIICGSI